MSTQNAGIIGSIGLLFVYLIIHLHDPWIALPKQLARAELGTQLPQVAQHQRILTMEDVWYLEQLDIDAKMTRIPLSSRVPTTSKIDTRAWFRGAGNDQPVTVVQRIVNEDIEWSVGATEQIKLNGQTSLVVVSSGKWICFNRQFSKRMFYCVVNGTIVAGPLVGGGKSLVIHSLESEPNLIVLHIHYRMVNYMIEFKVDLVEQNQGDLEEGWKMTNLLSLSFDSTLDWENMDLHFLSMPAYGVTRDNDMISWFFLSYIYTVSKVEEEWKLTKTYLPPLEGVEMVVDQVQLDPVGKHLVALTHSGNLVIYKRTSDWQLHLLWSYRGIEDTNIVSMRVNETAVAILLHQTIVWLSLTEKWNGSFVVYFVKQKKEMIVGMLAVVVLFVMMELGLRVNLVPLVILFGWLLVIWSLM
jgi:hypothetical protein